MAWTYQIVSQSTQCNYMICNVSWLMTHDLQVMFGIGNPNIPPHPIMVLMSRTLYLTSQGPSLQILVPWCPQPNLMLGWPNLDQWIQYPSCLRVVCFKDDGCNEQTLNNFIVFDPTYHPSLDVFSWTCQNYDHN